MDDLAVAWSPLQFKSILWSAADSPLQVASSLAPPKTLALLGPVHQTQTASGGLILSLAKLGHAFVLCFHVQVFKSAEIFRRGHRFIPHLSSPLLHSLFYMSTLMPSLTYVFFIPPPPLAFGIKSGLFFFYPKWEYLRCSFSIFYQIKPR